MDSCGQWVPKRVEGQRGRGGSSRATAREPSPSPAPVAFRLDPTELLELPEEGLIALLEADGQEVDDSVRTRLAQQRPGGVGAGGRAGIAAPPSREPSVRRRGLSSGRAQRTTGAASRTAAAGSSGAAGSAGSRAPSYAAVVSASRPASVAAEARGGPPRPVGETAAQGLPSAAVAAETRVERMPSGGATPSSVTGAPASAREKARPKRTGPPTKAPPPAKSPPPSPAVVTLDPGGALATGAGLAEPLAGAAGWLAGGTGLGASVPGVGAARGSADAPMSGSVAARGEAGAHAMTSVGAQGAMIVAPAGSGPPRDGEGGHSRCCSHAGHCKANPAARRAGRRAVGRH